MYYHANTSSKNKWLLKIYYKMKSNGNSKENNIKNRTCYYFDDIIKFEDFDIDYILINEKSYENIFIYKISYKTMIGSKPLRIRFDKTDRFIRVYDGARYLVLFGAEKYDSICNRMRYLIGLKCGFFLCFSRNYAKISVGSYNSLPIFHNFVISQFLIKIKITINYNIFLEKCSYKLYKYAIL